MPYDATDLTPNDPTKLTWAVAWARLLTGDRHAPHQWSDDEITATLTATAWTHEGTTYYRPHRAAAALIEADTTRPQAESTLGASITHRDARSLATSILKSGAWIDDLIAQTTGVRPPTGRTLEVTW